MKSSDLPLAGQRALVTGASSGIGEAIAQGLAAAGARLLVNYVHDKEEADRVIEAIRGAGGSAIAVHADISSESEVQSMFGAMHEAYGGIDILVNNAGLQQDAALVDMTLHAWNKVISVNLTGHFLCAREAARAFVRQGAIEGLSSAAGKIIFVSSVHDIIPWAGHANYAASKGGIMMLMKTLAQELAASRIRVNAISPGAIRTPINRTAWETPDALSKLLKLIPYGRIGEPEDIGRSAVWLASDASDYMTGATLYIDGGMTLYPGFESGG